MLFFRIRTQTPCKGMQLACLQCEIYVDTIDYIDGGLDAGWESWEDVAMAQSKDLFADYIGLKQQLGDELSQLCDVYRPRC